MVKITRNFIGISAILIVGVTIYLLYTSSGFPSSGQAGKKACTIRSSFNVDEQPFMDLCMRVAIQDQAGAQPGGVIPNAQQAGSRPLSQQVAALNSLCANGQRQVHTSTVSGSEKFNCCDCPE